MRSDNERQGRNKDSGQGAFAFASAGLELSAGIGGCVLIGYLIDRWFGTGNTGILAGAVIGCVGGMYHLISRALAFEKSRRAREERRAKERHEQDSTTGNRRRE